MLEFHDPVAEKTEYKSQREFINHHISKLVLEIL